MKPHKHAEFIKAWADGAEIEFRTEKTEGWHPVFKGWSWDNAIVAEYRIKPEPEPDVVQMWWASSNAFPWLRTIGEYNLKLTFDGETGKLKSAEVVS